MPQVNYEAVVYRKSRPDKAVKTRFLDPKKPNYSVFLGHDNPMMVADTDVGNGRRVLLVKNSYGNPFAVFLLASFERVVVIDYRYFKKNFWTVLEEQEITDVVFLNGIITAGSHNHMKLVRFLNSRR